MKLTKKLTSRILEAAIFAEGKPISAEKLRKVFPRGHRPPLGEIRGHLDEMAKHYQNRGVQLVEVASGFRFQVAEDISGHLLEQQEEKPMRMSKAFMETLALVAYRQPITRGEIEDIRGVAVSTNIIKALQELEWVREVGHKDVPGKPALFATTRKFLDFFNLKSLGDLPPLAQLQELSEHRMEEEFKQLNLELEQEMTEEEREQAQKARLAREATLSPDFVGPHKPESATEEESEDEVDLDALTQAAFKNLDEIEAKHQPQDEDAQEDLHEESEAERLDEYEAIEDQADEALEDDLDSLSDLDFTPESSEYDQAQTYEEVAIESFEDEEASTDYEADFEVNDVSEEASEEVSKEQDVNLDSQLSEYQIEASSEQAQEDSLDQEQENERMIAQALDEAPQEQSESTSSSIIDSALRKMREDLGKSQEKVSNQDDIEDQESQYDASAIIQELKDEQKQVTVEETAKNHRPLDGFSDIVITSSQDLDDDIDEANEDG